MTVSAPPPVTCPHFAPPPGERRCRHYLPNGACDRPDEFMCVEWLKAHGPSASADAKEGVGVADAATGVADAAAGAADAAAGAADAAADASGTAGRFSQRWRSLFNHAPPRLSPPPRPARGRRASPAPPPPAPTPASLAALSLAPTPASLASTEDVASLAERYAETQLETDTLGPVWFVTEPTGADRLELTYRDAAALAAVCAAFPGARVVALERAKKKSTESTEPRVPKPRAR